MDIRISGTVNDSIVDGPGIRYVIFTQGCPHHCPGCHNPQTHEMSGGEIMDTQAIIEEFRKNPLLDGITLSGGEPFCQPQPLCEIAEAAVSYGLNIVTYTGYTFEQLLEKSESDIFIPKLLLLTDLLIDGRFVKEQKTLDEAFKGSANQRILDCKKSFEQRIAIEWEEEYF